MGRAWIVFLAACGFRTEPVAGGSDAAVDAAIDSGQATCWKLEYANFDHLSACGAVGPDVTITADISLDTDSGVAMPAGLTCTQITVGTGKVVCAVVASSISIPATRKLFAHGSRPLALLAHSITINGTVDVASHVALGPTQAGAGSGIGGCNPGTPASGGGGGAGGTRSTDGGDGGDQAGTATTGGTRGSSFSDSVFAGGCPGGAGHSAAGFDLLGPGLGGGAVWISSDTGSLVMGTAAVINASGAGGKGGSLVLYGGSGGGSGGVIVLQAPTMTLDGSAKIFANGGHGGGGSNDVQLGTDGSDPTAPANGGTQGAGGPPEAVGGEGFPATGGMHNGKNGKNPAGGGGGGGGGGGVIRVATSSSVVIDGSNFSPAGERLAP